MSSRSSSIDTSCPENISSDVFEELVKELQNLNTTNPTPLRVRQVEPLTRRSARRRVPVDFPKSQVTSLMVRNVPVTLTQREALSLFMDSFGKAELIDFFYLPTDISKKQRLGLGFCFVNFATAEASAEFRRVFAGRPLLAGGFPLAISTAAVQGLANNIENVRLNPTVRRIKNPDYLPLTKNEHGRFIAVSLLPCSPIIGDSPIVQV